MQGRFKHIVLFLIILFALKSKAQNNIVDFFEFETNLITFNDTIFGQHLDSIINIRNICYLNNDINSSYFLIRSINSDTFTIECFSGSSIPPYLAGGFYYNNHVFLIDNIDFINLTFLKKTDKIIRIELQKISIGWKSYFVVFYKYSDQKFLVVDRVDCLIIDSPQKKTLQKK